MDRFSYGIRDMSFIVKLSAFLFVALVWAATISGFAAANTVPTSKAADSTIAITPTSCTVPVTIAVLAPGQYQTVTIASARTGTLSATWKPSVRRNITLSIYAYSGGSWPQIASNSGNVTTITTSAGSRPPDEYAVVFYNSDSVNVTTTSASVTYMKLTCP